MAQPSSPARIQAPPPRGAFDRLSHNNQEIARALYLAQNTRVPAPPFRLDEIASRRERGEGWGHIFESIRAQGLVEGNLGQIMAYYNHQLRLTPSQASKAPGPQRPNVAPARRASRPAPRPTESGRASSPPPTAGLISPTPL